MQWVPHTHEVLELPEYGFSKMKCQPGAITVELYCMGRGPYSGYPNPNPTWESRAATVSRWSTGAGDSSGGEELVLWAPNDCRSESLG